ncbi:hypothetical protein ACFTXM_26660, partial [Streptomyces sp. NPDC056930]|uniref:hypothetical protein n=1 Tax=Streptomyces sp. NPDC056930 TaxID=3345967 RepID=UPI003641598F
GAAFVVLCPAVAALICAFAYHRAALDTSLESSKCRFWIKRYRVCTSESTESAMRLSRLRKTN